MTVHGSFEWVEALDAQLTRLARGAGALWLSFGLVLEALARRGGHHDLGFSSLEAYGVEHCRRSKRWIQEVRTVARRLGGLPAVRHAVLCGKLNWSMTALLARVATAEDEVAWLLLAHDRTVRQMEQLVHAVHADHDASHFSAGKANGVGSLGGAYDRHTRVANDDETAPGEADPFAEAESRASDGAAGHISAGEPEPAIHMSADQPRTDEAAGHISAGPPDPPETDHDYDLCQPEPERTLTVTVDQPDAWLFECARMLVGRIGGSTAADAALEALLAEGEATMLAWLPEGASGEIEADPMAKAQRQWEVQLEQWRREAEALCEARIANAPVPEVEQPVADVPTLEELMLESSEELDRRLRRAADELARRDVEIGQLADRLWQADGWRRLGYATARQYASERLGMGVTSVTNKRQLARRLNKLPEIARAVESGDVGYEDARLLAQVATESTSGAWVERARERTAKHLRAEVAAAGLLSRLADDEATVPPTVEQMDAVEMLQAKVLSGDVFTSDVFTEDEGVAEAFDTMLAACERSHRPTARVTLRLRVREGTYWHYKAREKLHRQHGPGGSFLRFLCLSLIETWKSSLRSGVAYEPVYARDRFECASPVCSRRDVTPHHLRYRSHGGDDSLDNLLSLCVWCHLRGIHEGRLRATPPASDVHWEIGQRGHTIVHGRRKVRRDDGVRVAA